MIIQFYNRKSKSYEVEKVAGERYLNWIYSSPIGMGFLEMIVKKKLFSKLYGCYCDSALSRKKINTFIEGFNIDMSLCENDKFCSFNDFFIRQLKKQARPICEEENILISPCDGKLLAYKDINIDSLVQVKGITYKLSELINNERIISKYQHGTCMIFRLCPTDYHRFHFIDKGTCSETKKIKGNYYSVNPIALSNVPKLFCENKREWSILHSTNFKDILYIEVGATCVGSIIQTYTANTPVNKGDEKGYFKFGGSTVILFFEKDSLLVDEDILDQSKLGHESSVLLGEQIAVKRY